MKCLSCKKENTVGAKFCKYCGSPMEGSYKTCANGHNYESHLSKCPFCPTTDFEKTLMDNSLNEKTVLDKSSRGDKTIIDSSAPTLKARNSVLQGSDKTVIFNANSQSETNPQSSQRKLVGWFVTYDINPNGTDFRIFEGRLKIGKSNRNDIILNQMGISDEHAILLYRDNKFVIQDNLSTNGTFVNSVSIDEKVILKNDDIIKIGSVNLKLKVI